MPNKRANLDEVPYCVDAGNVEVHQPLERTNAKELLEHRMQVGGLLKTLYQIRHEVNAHTEPTVDSHGEVVAVVTPTSASQAAIALGIGMAFEMAEAGKRSAPQAALARTSAIPSASASFEIQKCPRVLPGSGSGLDSRRFMASHQLSERGPFP